MNHYLGVDVGTSGCKAVAFDQQGNQIAAAYREYDVLSPQDGWAELDSDLVMERCFEVIAETANALPANSVRGLGISSQGEAFTPIDSEGRCLGNGMISSDQRALQYVREWPATFGPEKLYEITGHTPHPMFTIFKLLWVRDNRRDVWYAAEKFLCFEDLLQYRLGLHPAIAWSLAGRTMLFDVTKHEWNGEILEEIGMSPDRLATPMPSGAIAGTIPEDIGRQLGLGTDVFVVTGGHDQPCGALGAGVTTPDLAMYATGTVECITPVCSMPVFSDELWKSNLCTYDHAVADMYATVAFSLTGGNILKWFRDQFGAADVATAERRGVNPYEVLLEQIGNEPAGPMVLPYFTPTGTPYFDADITGAVVGLRLSTTRGEFVRALLEGVAFEMRLNLDILDRAGYDIRELRAVGGGAKSAIWNQLKADVIGKPLTTLNVTEAGCLGTAMLACAAHTGESLATLAYAWVQPQSEVAPRSDWADWYTRRFRQYKEIYPAVRELDAARLPTNK